MASHQRPLCREDFNVALICALPLEFDAICMVVDEFWDHEGDPYGRGHGDRNTYVTGRIGKHNIVITMLGMGKVNSATTATSLRSSYPNIQLAILVGICGAIPYIDAKPVRLGDVIISDIIVQYDFGRQINREFVRKKTSDSSSGPVSRDVLNLLTNINTSFGRRRLHERTMVFSEHLTAAATRAGQSERYRSPDAAMGNLLESMSQRQILAEKECEGDERLKLPAPAIYLGPMASGDTVMLSAERRDKIARDEGVIAFEMEGAGLWRELPCLVVKGVSDYANSEKTKTWQDYAAATAAAASKAVLERYVQTDKPKTAVSYQLPTARQAGSTYDGNVEAMENVNQGNEMRVSSKGPLRNYEQEGSSFKGIVRAERNVRQGNVMEFW
ncbi:hypothetical protein FSARC_14912 [Fusarium sarcochroum]|uniref:Nucleoside phosphorylase domain-containing protein n=1 Tax=Fusarium sarcochroum TaxID=1208366 RepID=A0A8H4SQ27_9HYPO|nr:hypothetical protein FSARC_14912 [Fusarium sarcochroum]